jgi:hypothetical protein
MAAAEAKNPESPVRSATVKETVKCKSDYTIAELFAMDGLEYGSGVDHNVFFSHCFF